MEINKIYYYEGNKRLFKVEIGDEKFVGVEGIKLEESKCRKCKHNCEDWNVIRRFECKRNLDRVKTLYITITATVVFCVAFHIFRNLQLSFPKKIAILLVILVVFDILCTLIEEIVPKIYDWLFYKKLKRNKNKKEKIEEANRREEEERRKKEEEEKRRNMPNYRKIETAQNVVKYLYELSDKYDFGPNEERINVCVQKSEEILNQVQEDYTGESYKRVIFLFEAYLPEFCDTLEFYGDFIKVNAVTKEHQKVLTECVDVILEYLEKQKVKAVLDKESVETRFQAVTDTLKKALKEELNK